MRDSGLRYTVTRAGPQVGPILRVGGELSVFRNWWSFVVLVIKVATIIDCLIRYTITEMTMYRTMHEANPLEQGKLRNWRLSSLLNHIETNWNGRTWCDVDILQSSILSRIVNMCISCLIEFSGNSNRHCRWLDTMYLQSQILWYIVWLVSIFNLLLHPIPILHLKLATRMVQLTWYCKTMSLNIVLWAILYFYEIPKLVIGRDRTAL